MTAAFLRQASSDTVDCISQEKEPSLQRERKKKSGIGNMGEISASINMIMREGRQGEGISLTAHYNSRDIKHLSLLVWM